MLSVSIYGYINQELVQFVDKNNELYLLSYLYYYFFSLMLIFKKIDTEGIEPPYSRCRLDTLAIKSRVFFISSKFNLNSS